MTRVRPVTLLLLAVITSLGLVIGWQADHEPALTATAPPTGRPATLPAVPKLARPLPAISAFSDIAERPLFVEARRPPAPAVETAAKGEPAPQWNLVGTAITSGGRAALLFDERTREFLVMRPGTRQAGWALADIQAERVVLEKGQSKHEIELPRF